VTAYSNTMSCIQRSLKRTYSWMCVQY